MQSQYVVNQRVTVFKNWKLNPSLSRAQNFSKKDLIIIRVDTNSEGDILYTGILASDPYGKRAFHFFENEIIK